MIPQSVVTSTLNSANLGETEIVEKLKAMTEGAGFDFVLDCVGVPELISAGHKALSTKGVIVTVGGGPPTAEAKIGLSTQLIGGRTYRGTHQGDSVPATVCCCASCGSTIPMKDADSFLKATPMLVGLWRQGKLPARIVLFTADRVLGQFDFDKLLTFILTSLTRV